MDSHNENFAVHANAIGNSSAVARCASIDTIADAIRSGAIYPVFQSQVCAATGIITGAEALARWRHHSAISIQPADFIARIEGDPLERSLVAALIAAIARLARVHLGYTGSFSLNLSQWLLAQPGIDEWFAAQLCHHDLPAQRLVLEVTERHAVSDADIANVRRHMRALRQHGLTLSLDDFGVGTATPLSLERYDYAEVKIDRHFLQRARRNGKSQGILAGMVALAHDAGARVVIEGVETPGDAFLAHALGAETLQGYRFGKPGLFRDIAARASGMQAVAVG